MKPTEDLMYEHRSIKLMLKIMSLISKSIKSKNVFYTNDVERIVDFLNVYVDKCHQTKEEKYFYPALLIYKNQDQFDTTELLNEHTIGKGYLKEISCCVENCKIGSTFSCERIADCMTNFVDLLQNHIQKEENVYFPLADKLLSEQKQIEISGQFQTVENEFLNIVNHKRFVELLNEMTCKYKDKILTDTNQDRF